MFKTLEERRVLSPREIEVMDLVSQGKLNKQIAFSLGISEGTVKNHVSSIFLKTGYSTRIELAIRWNEAKWKL